MTYSLAKLHHQQTQRGNSNHCGLMQQCSRSRSDNAVVSTDGATWGPNWSWPPLAPTALYRFACRCMYVINFCISCTMLAVAD